MDDDKNTEDEQFHRVDLLNYPMRTDIKDERNESQADFYTRS